MYFYQYFIMEFYNATSIAVYVCTQLLCKTIYDSNELHVYMLLPY